MMKTCLIVDDSRVIRKVSRHILEALGFVDVGQNIAVRLTQKT